ncbi:MAG TPA: TlpA disulfide reductase family protein [Patescibacteria group bacterium]|nr:TlpA disulfide reductase family protein [Patescibacteria group bacterium]
MTTTVWAAVVALFCTTIPLAAEFTHAPDLTLSDLKGSKVKVDYRAGKLTLVNFWAVWCGPCREEMPHIARLFGKYSSQGFQAVGVAVQSGESSDVKEFLEQNKDYGINYPILMGVDETLERFGDVQAVPTTYLIDPTGKVLKRFIGVTPGFAVKLEDEISKAIGPDSSKPSKPPKPTKQ